MEPGEQKDAMLKRLEDDFTYHAPPDEATVQKYQELRDKAKELAVLMVDSCPAGRSLSTALTKVEEAVMHANAGIARQG